MKGLTRSEYSCSLYEASEVEEIVSGLLVAH